MMRYGTYIWVEEYEVFGQDQADDIVSAGPVDWYAGVSRFENLGQSLLRYKIQMVRS